MEVRSQTKVDRWAEPEMKSDSVDRRGAILQALHLLLLTKRKRKITPHASFEWSRLPFPKKYIFLKISSLSTEEAKHIK